MLREHLKRIRSRVLLLLLIGGVLLLWVAMGWPCMIRSITGFPCPGCGLSRAWLAALRLDFGAAFRFHPMFWSIPILALFLLLDGQLFRQRWANRVLLAVLLGGMAVSYVIRIVGFLSGVPTV